MNHKERMHHVIRREATDRIPVAFWRHFPVDDQDPFRLAISTIDFQNIFDFDFVKISPSSSFCLKDWGAHDEWCGNPEGTREYINPVITQASDWSKIKELNPHKGYLNDQLTCIKLIKQELPSDTPIIQTVFSPLSQAKNLAGKKHILNHMRSYPEEILAGLKIITKSTTNFIEACSLLGVDGIFFAEQFATFDYLSSREFEIFGTNFDKQIFPALKQFWLNVLHIHGLHIMFDELIDFPMQVFNWHDQETEPSLKTGSKLLPSAVCGGLSINSLVYGNPESIKKMILKSFSNTESNGFILGSGCVLPMITPHGNIKSAVDFIRSYT